MMLKNSHFPYGSKIKGVISLALVLWCAFSLPVAAQDKSLPVRSTLVVLNPAHPHGAQMQQGLKSLLQRDVYVYAPPNNDVDASYLSVINRYNASMHSDTTWRVHVHIGEDYLKRMLQDKKGDVVLIASNNQTKADYILKAAAAGFNVIADKPMAVTSSDFVKLRAAFLEAEKHNKFVSDLPTMSMRNQVIYLLQKELATIPEIFGALEMGSPENPAVVQENMHHYYKSIKRPTWFFDVKQQGNGVTDVTTHLADLVLWTCFPEQEICYEQDVEILSARLWPTMITPAQFKKVTQIDGYPDFLKPYQDGDQLKVFSNGEIISLIKGVYVRLTARWDFAPPAGKSDTYHSLLRGTRAILQIKPGQPTDLYIKPAHGIRVTKLERELHNHVNRLKKDYPFISLHKEKNGWRITSQQRTLGKNARIVVPTKREVERMLAKYYITTQADAVAKLADSEH